jgi:putative membrane protein
VKVVKVLILSVDRDDDFGVKAGLHSPFIGRQENLDAAVGLGLKDPEDSDINTILAAISIYEEMVKKGMDAEVATICGDIKVGYESDVALATQLENVLEMVKPDRVVLVSDGAEDEYIFPMVASRVKVDSVKRVFVKQAPTVEGTYYIFVKMMKDDKVRKRVLFPIGLVFAILGTFALLPKIFEYMEAPSFDIIASMGFGFLGVALGLYLIFYAYHVGERTMSALSKTARAIKSGSQMILFTVLAAIFLIAGVAAGLNAAQLANTDDLTYQALLFMGGTLWPWMFAAFCYASGKFVSLFLDDGKVHWTYIVTILSVFAIGFITQGAIDVTIFILGYQEYDQLFIGLEILAGFLLAGFSGLLNASLRAQTSRSEDKGESLKEGKESIN